MLVISFGTRPEYLKIKPILDGLDRSLYKLLFTGQHLDLIQTEYFIDYVLDIRDGKNRLDSIVQSILNQEDIFSDCSHVLVQGDTTSAFAVALAAFHRKIKVIHLEAGLRTFDVNNPYPEEFNRRAISGISDLNFCPTELSRQNLERERVPGEIFVTGNTILDSLVDVNTEYGSDVLVTLHRRENHDIMEQWFGAIESLATSYTDLNFIVPVHPNPKVKMYANVLRSATVVDPLGYNDLIKTMASCKLVITDSGGIQEESSFLGKKALVCRKTTERVEGLGKFHFLVDSPDTLSSLFEEHIYDYEVDRSECPYGDGTASKQIIYILNLRDVLYGESC